MTALMAAGVLPAVPILGLWLCRTGDAPVRFSQGMAVPLGLMIWAPMLAVSAGLGIYHPLAWGVLGWIVTFSLGPKVLGQSPGVLAAAGRRPALPLLMLLVAWLGYQYHADSLLGGIDEGVYSNQALQIARTGRLSPDYPIPAMSEPEYLPLRQSVQRAGLYLLETIIVQFPPTYPTVMAQLAACFGVEGLFLVNALLSGLNLLTFYLLCRIFLRHRISLLCCAGFGLNLSQVALSRLTLSEMMLQTFLLGAFLCLTCGLKHRQPRLLWLGYLLMAGGFSVKLESALVLPPLVAAAGLRSLYTRFGGLRSLTPLLAFPLVLAYHAWTCWPYLLHLTPNLLAAGGGALALGLSFLLLHRVQAQGRLRALLQSPHLARGWNLLLLCLAITGLFFRSSTPPPDADYSGFRAYDSHALVNLAAYLSPWLFALGVLGAIWLSGRVLKGQMLWSLPLLGTWLAFALLFGYDPMVWPDQPWGSRRFQPLIIPGFLLMAGLGWRTLERRLPRANRGSAILILWLLVLAHLSWIGRKAWTVRSHDGSSLLLERTLALIDPNFPLLVHSSTVGLAEPLMLRKGAPCIFLDFGKRNHLVLARGLTNKRPLQVVSSEPLPSLRVSPKVVNQAVLWSTNPSAWQVEYTAELETLYVYEIQDLPAFHGPRILVGDVVVPGVQESGLWSQERHGGQPVRWTDGRAQLIIPVDDALKLDSIELELLGFKLNCETRINLNGRTLYHKRLEGAPITVRLKVPEGLRSVNPAELTLTSETFQAPSDDRNLGLLIGRIQLNRK